MPSRLKSMMPPGTILGVIMDKKPKGLVVKSNRLVEASYRLTLMEQRIVLFAVVEARRTQNGVSADSLVTIKASDFAQAFGLSLNQTYDQLREAVRALYERTVRLYDVHPETGKERKTDVRWVQRASYIDAAAMIELRFSTDMLPHIMHLEEQFTRYQLEQIAGLTSAHAIRLYELLVQWDGVGKREVQMNWLRKAFMLEDQYVALKDLKKWVIDVAVAQINEHTDLTVSYTQRKTGRIVTHLIFEFGKKDKSTAKSCKMTKEYIEKHARVGESWEDAEKRLRSSP